MADSRSAAELEIGEKQWPLNAKITYFLFCIISSIALTFYIADGSYSDSQKYVLFIFFLSIGLWVTEAIPPFAVGILIIGYLVYTQGSGYLNSDPESVDRYLNSWVSPVIWLMLGGFFLAEGLTKTGLDRSLLNLAIKRKFTKPAYLLLAVMFVTAFGSMIMSNTATTAMMIAGIMPLIKILDSTSGFKKALLIAIPSSASIGGMATIIGSPPNAIAVGALSQAYNINIDFIDWMIFGVPISFCLILIFWAVLKKRFLQGIEFPDLSLVSKNIVCIESNKIPKRVVLATTIITLFMWMTTPLHNIPSAVISGLPIIFLTVGGVLNSKDVRNLPWDTLMLVAGGLSLGVALSHTGLVEIFVNSVSSNLNGIDFILIALLAGFITIALSNVMSNTAAATILIPIGAALMPQDPKLAVLTIGLAASAALFFPVSTPPNAIAFSTGVLKASDFRLGGVVLGLIAPIVIVILLVLFL